MSPEYSPTRRHGRLTFRELVSGGVTATHDIHVLDLSLGGARIEHAVILRPGNSCYLRLPLKQQVVTVMARVVWSKAVGRAAGKPAATTGLLYQSGLEFGTLAQEAHALLTAFLEIEGTPPGNGRPAG
jgi:hypothetical protein